MRLVHVKCPVYRPRRVSGADRMRARAIRQGSRQNRAGPPGRAEQANRRVFDPKLALSCHLGNAPAGPRPDGGTSEDRHRGSPTSEFVIFFRIVFLGFSPLRPCVTPARFFLLAASSVSSRLEGAALRLLLAASTWCTATGGHLIDRPPAGRVRGLARRRCSTRPGACRGPGRCSPAAGSRRRSGAPGSHLSLPDARPRVPRFFLPTGSRKRARNPWGGTRRVTPRARATCLT